MEESTIAKEHRLGFQAGGKELARIVRRRVE
jgi:hypothetical protein